MVRDTSIQTYNEINNNGLLSNRRLEVYKVIYNYGPLTSAEAYNIMNKDKPKSTLISQSRARFTELRDMKCLKELGTKTCDITGKKAILWDVTSSLPIGRPTVKTKNQKKKEILELISLLGEEIDVYYKADLRVIYKKVKNL